MTAINRISRNLIISGIFLMAVITGCSTVRVQSDYDREIYFANFHTFDWTAQSENAVQHNTLFERRLKKAVDKELTANGFQKQTGEIPDFLIAYSIKEEYKVNVLSSVYNYGGYGFRGFSHSYGNYGFGYGFGYNGYGLHSFGYGSGYYGGSGLYTEVTLVLNFVDPESNNVIWQGVYKENIDERGIMTEDKITTAVKKILEEFPPDQMIIADRSF